MRINGDKIYKSDEFIHFVRKHDGSNRDIVGKGGVKSSHSNYESVEVPFDDFIKVNLNTNGESVPYSNRNVINLSRYMFWYWTPLIGSDAVALYTLLTEYCNDETDICFPKIKDLAERLGRSVPTIRKALSVLEENNFVIVIYRLNKKKNRKETSPIFKVRQTTPLISSQQYSQLPSKLKAKHDEFVERNMSLQLPETTYNHKEVVNSLIESGNVLMTKRKEEKILASLATEEARDKVLVSMSSKQLDFNETIHRMLTDEESEMTKPSYDSFFSDTIFVRTSHDKFIISCSQVTSEMLKIHNMYWELIKDLLMQFSPTGVTVEISCYDLSN